MKQTIIEAVGFVVLAGAVGLFFNAQRSDGLEISRNYFPAGSVLPPSEAPSPDDEDTAPEHEFNVVTLAEALEYYDFGNSSILFIDARDDSHYERCHIPNAIQFDYYHPQDYLEGVRDFSSDAEVIIIYCNGGECEDSLLAARYLTSEIDNPLPLEALYVFEDGIQAWVDAGYEREPEDCKP